MAKLRKKIIEFPNNIPTPGSAFLYAKKNPNGSYTTSNYTYEQMITLLNAELSFSTGGSSVLYSNVYFVDGINGNDLTGLAGDMSKPYLSIQAAIQAATLTGSFNINNRALIYVRPGSYGNIVLSSYIDIYCDENVTIFGDIRDNTVDVDCNIYGYAKFRGTLAMLITGNSNIRLNFDTADVSGAFIIALASIGSNIYIKGNYIKAGTSGTTFANSIRGKVNLQLHLSEYGESIHTFMDIRNKYSGNLDLTIPEIRLLEGNLYGVDFKQAIHIRDCNDANIKINAKMIKKDTSTTHIYGMFAANSMKNSTVTINGDIESGNGRSIYIINSDLLSSVTYKGKMSSSVGVIYGNGAATLIVNDSVINNNLNTSTEPVVLLDETIFAQFNNVQIKSKTTESSFYIVKGLNYLSLINVYYYNSAALGLLINGTLACAISAVNTVSNVNVNTLLITNTLTTPIVVDTNFKLL
jgi:hypothetical protein